MEELTGVVEMREHVVIGPTLYALVEDPRINVKGQAGELRGNPFLTISSDNQVDTHYTSPSAQPQRTPLKAIPKTIDRGAEERREGDNPNILIFPRPQLLRRKIQT